MGCPEKSPPPLAGRCVATSPAGWLWVFAFASAHHGRPALQGGTRPTLRDGKTDALQAPPLSDNPRTGVNRSACDSMATVVNADGTRLLDSGGLKLSLAASRAWRSLIAAIGERPEGVLLTGCTHAVSTGELRSDFGRGLPTIDASPRRRAEPWSVGRTASLPVFRREVPESAARPHCCPWLRL